MRILKDNNESRSMPSDIIRMKLYEMFIEYGGTIDSNESYFGIDKSCNNYVINKILMNIVQMRKEHYSEYCQILSTLITDCYAYLELENALGPLAKVLNNCINNKPSFFSQGDALQHKRDISLFERINTSSNIEEFEYNLQHDSQWLLIKDLIIPVLGAIAEEIITPCNHIDAIHYDSLRKPKNIELLSRYNTVEDMQEIYWRMLKSIAKENTKYRVIELLLKMYQYLLSENSDNPLEQVFILYKYCLDNFGQDLGDVFFYEFARCIYCHLIRKIINNKHLTPEEELLLKKLKDIEYGIDEIKIDLIPKENEMPELFIFFIKNAKDDFQERFDLSNKKLKEFDDYLLEFEKRFKDYCLKNT